VVSDNGEACVSKRLHEFLGTRFCAEWDALNLHLDSIPFVEGEVQIL